MQTFRHPWALRPIPRTLGKNAATPGAGYERTEVAAPARVRVLESDNTLLRIEAVLDPVCDWLDVLEREILDISRVFAIKRN